MHNKIISFLAGAALASSALCAPAADTSVATVPQGLLTFALPHGVTTYLSLPLTNNATYTGVVAAVTANSISVGDSPAPFTSALATPAAPYFVKFLSGSESGRVMLITGNNTSLVTVDTSDHISGSSIGLTTAGFNVQVGDTFEVFPGDTLASIFGTTTQNLVLTGGVTVNASDAVALYTTVGAPAVTYYFNTVLGYWQQNGIAGNANNTILYPYSAFTITRRANRADVNLVLAGRVTQVSPDTKVISQGTVYTSTHFATDVKLSQLQFGANWLTGTSVVSADTLSVWNPTENAFDTFYQLPNSTWRKFPDAVTDQSNYTIPTGSVTTIAKRQAVAGATAFLQSTLPYSLD